MHIRVSPEILKQLSEVYRKIRNTARFILGCISDFDPNTDCVTDDKFEEIDRFALYKLDNLVAECRKAYDNFEYHLIFHAIHNFCVLDMSNFYLDVLKDRLYVDKADSVSRRAAQTAMYRILDTLTRLVSPILAFTSDEIWQFMPHDSSCDTRNVIFNDMPTAKGVDDEAFMARWSKIFALREDVKKVLETARAEKVIGASLDASVTLYAKGEEYAFLEGVLPLLKSVFIVSNVTLIEGEGGAFTGDLGIGITAAHAEGEKCERCWSYSETVGKDGEHKTLCARCADVIKSL